MTYLQERAFGDASPRVAHLILRQIYRHSAWTSSARPSVAGTLTLKRCSRVRQNTPLSFKKLNNFLGRGLPRRLRRLDPRAFGAQPLAHRFQNPKYATGHRRTTHTDGHDQNNTLLRRFAVAHQPLTAIFRENTSPILDTLYIYKAYELQELRNTCQV